MTGSRHLFLYGAPAPVSEPLDGTGTTSARSWGEAARKALGWRGEAARLLVWHAGLLKLLPFFRLPRPHVTLFLHGIEVWRPLDPLTRLLLRRVDHFLSNSDHTWQRFLEFHPHLAGRAHQTIPLGLGSPLDGPPPAPDPVPAALIVARMARGEDYKGHRELIEAWPRLLAQLPEAHLWVAGDGDLRPELEALVRARGLAHRIHFLGRVSEEQKQRLLERCRCFAMPSRGEGFGLVYLEAMRWGRPCLVSNDDAGQEVVAPPEAGLAVEPSDAAAVAEGLQRLLTPGPAWDAWSRQARARYESHYTAAHFQQRLIAALFEPGVVQ